eukprot:7574971-Pyramimonas_sp.AAC.1
MRGYTTKPARSRPKLRKTAVGPNLSHSLYESFVIFSCLGHGALYFWPAVPSCTTTTVYNTMLAPPQQPLHHSPSRLR